MSSYFKDITNGQRIVSVVNYKDMVLIATEHNIYSVKDGKIKLMVFEVQENK